jgi:hypothetical protein
MRGGTISGNAASRGGGVALLPVKNTPPQGEPEEGAAFLMADGLITDNEASDYGGAVALITPGESLPNTDTDGTPSKPSYIGAFSMTGGFISGNEAAGKGGGLGIGSAQYYSVTIGPSGTVSGNSGPGANAAPAGPSAWIKDGTSSGVDKNLTLGITNTLGPPYSGW